jgi:isochorismate synthase
MARSNDIPLREESGAPPRADGPGETRLLAAAAPLDASWDAAEDALSLGAGEPWFRLVAPGAGERLAAWGESARCEAASAAEVPALLSGMVRRGQLRFVTAAPSYAPGHWLGALAFDLSRGLGGEWDGFAPARFTAPQMLLWSRGNETFLAAIAGDGPGAAAQVAGKLAEARASISTAPALQEAAQAGEAIPAFVAQTDPAVAWTRWKALVLEALDSIRAGSISKVVVARAIDLALTSPVDARRLARRLAARFPTCRTFLLRGQGSASFQDAASAQGSASFIGATPETFLSLSSSRFVTEALAGSAPPGHGGSLLKSNKDLREHGWVVDHLLTGLQPLTARLDTVAPPTVRSLPNVEHLASRVSGQLRPEVGLAELVAALHPTPAVGGVPAAAAQHFLRTREELDRGLYAGLLGAIGEGRAELVVALRSALVRGRSARLFVGAGIVEGSTPDGEWQETQLKARALLSALEGE